MSQLTKDHDCLLQSRAQAYTASPTKKTAWAGEKKRKCLQLTKPKMISLLFLAIIAAILTPIASSTQSMTIDYSVVYRLVPTKLRGREGQSKCGTSEYHAVGRLMSRELSVQLGQQLHTIDGEAAQQGPIMCADQLCSVGLLGGENLDEEQDAGIVQTLKTACDSVLTKVSKEKKIGDQCQSSIATAGCEAFVSSSFTAAIS